MAVMQDYGIVAKFSVLNMWKMGNYGFLPASSYPGLIKQNLHEITLASL